MKPSINRKEPNSPSVSVNDTWVFLLISQLMLTAWVWIFSHLALILTHQGIINDIKLRDARGIYVLLMNWSGEEGKNPLCF